MAHHIPFGTVPRERVLSACSNIGLTAYVNILFVQVSNPTLLAKFMYLLSMRRGYVLFGSFLATVVLGCQAATSPRFAATVQPQPTRALGESETTSRTPPTRQVTATAVTNQIVRDLAEFGFSVDGQHLNVVVAKKPTFVEGLAQNATHFEMPGLFEALSTMARLFGMRQGRDPAELKELARKAIGEATLAFYDHVSKSLVFRDDADSRMLNLESLVAHELAHAYQDQAQGGLAKFISDHRTSLDSLRAAHGVLEGQAVIVGTGVEWYKRGISIDRLDPDIADATVGRLASGESFSIVYEAGRRFALMRYRAGGWPMVTDAFRHPPTSTEQLLHPEKFRRDLPSEVTLPATPALLKPFPLAFDGTVGELLLYNRLLLIAQDLNRARFAAAGWDGDRLQVYALPAGGFAAMWRILWDRRGDAEQFESVTAHSLKARKFVSLKRRGRVTDIVYAESQPHYAALAKALAAHATQYKEDPFEATSTAAVENAWELAEQKRPFVDADRWVLPEYGFSFQIPSRYSAVTVRGVDLLATMPVEGFANNISLVYEQDLFDGDIERYVSEAQRQTMQTSQKWLTHQTITLGKSKAAIVELEVPGGQHLMSMSMLVLGREGKWLTITCATLAKQKGAARGLLAGIIQTLRLE